MRARYNIATSHQPHLPQLLPLLYLLFADKKGANSEQLKVIQIKRISMATKLLPLNLYTILTIWK